MKLSVVIPTLNEAHKVAADIEAASAFIAEQCGGGEVILVDDGSTDGTADKAECADVPQAVDLRVIRSGTNRGKGWAVRTGMQSSRGQYAMFADAGLCIAYEQALRGLRLLQRESCEIAHATRYHPDSFIVRHKGFYRRIVSRLARLAIPLIAGLPASFTDTQCGFKIYRGDVARELFRDCVCNGFLFDVEVVHRALDRGYRICEFPVTWRSDPDSRLRPMRSLPALLRQAWQIRRTVCCPAQTAHAE